MTDVVSGRSAPPQSSAYRNLAVLEHAGVVRRVITEGEFARFELTEELTEHHHHLICSRCGRVEDVTVPRPGGDARPDRSTGSRGARGSRTSTTGWI